MIETPLQRYLRLEKRLQRRKRIWQVPLKRLRDRENPLEQYNAVQFKQRYHVFKDTAIYVTELIKEDLAAPLKRGVHIPPVIQLLIAQRFFATGAIQLCLGDHANVSQPTVSKIVKKVAIAIARRKSQFIRFPRHDEASMIREDFYRVGNIPSENRKGFPGVTGIIDGTHIGINSPGGNDAELFRNRKGTFSVNVQAVCDAKLQFTNIVARWYGSAHDSRVFENSNLSFQLETGTIPGILLGDSAYSCRPYMMTPILEPSTPAQYRYNKSFLRTRNVIERCFGVWKQKFACLRLMRLKVKTVLTIAVATAVLHNITRFRHDILDDDLYYATYDEEPIQYQNNNSTIGGRATQNEIINSHFA